MYPYMYPVYGAVPVCYYCPMVNEPVAQPAKRESMMRGEENDGVRSDAEGTASPTPPMGQQMPGMQGTPGMQGMDMGKITADTQEIVRMFEQQHPDIMRTLTASGMSMGQARQYLSRIVEMTLMHHMMHQM